MSQLSYAYLDSLLFMIIRLEVILLLRNAVKILCIVCDSS